MNKINNQVEILENLSKILDVEADTGYEYLECKFEVDEQSVNTKFVFSLNGSIVNRAISLKNRLQNMRLVLMLHSMMKSQTGGDWKSMTLTIDENREAKTHFEY
ncbi:hypothetical protein OE749_08380 [Aestuariibacter sp. AA17]|uniref:Uncharacterized protein n=1 Tax=Fluctibacter corallii TaxID=2984329 RepID=A0ABT3A7Q2_9ALTE|nr:hypothetical protein [Aestuariibacter sp. AA17]MCV2884710.1 hypothetical protein [Aestuariibacter sp. AA17]